MDGRNPEPPESAPGEASKSRRESLTHVLRRIDPWWRWPTVAILSLITLVLIALFAGWLLMRGSLPQTEGVVKLPGLAGQVTVTRDAYGMPTIHAQNELDAWRVLGYIEAQDRFVQMDFTRRLAAGSLSELVGAAALPLDRKHRVFQLQKKAHRIYANASPAERARLEVYALGVNEGLDDLTIRPWPYLLLGASPRPWEPADSVLVIYAMAFLLEDPWGQRGRSLAALKALYPPSVVAFLMAPDVPWAAPMRGSPPELPPIPGTRAINLALAAPAVATNQSASGMPPAQQPGSNSFVVSGNFTQSGKSLLANDMHLPLGIPSTWYRARMVYPSRKAPYDKMTLTGVFLPGVPALVVGSNGHIAWGFTNNYGDWVDLIRVRTHGDLAVYDTPSGSESVEVRHDPIRVNGEESVPFKIRYTRWGPVIGTTADGELLVSHWSVAQPGGINLAFIHMSDVATVKEAMKLAPQAGIPPQNLLVADETGAIGWTTIGRIPARFSGCDYNVPQTWADGRCGWSGWLSVKAYPQIMNPDSGFLVTANNRIDASAAGDVLGDGGYADGARAHQIVADVKALIAKKNITPTGMLSVQLDDRAVYLTRWHDLILKVLRPSALEYHPKRQAFREAVANWGGHAAVDSVGYRLVHDFHWKVIGRVFGPIHERLQSWYSEAELPFDSQLEGPLWRLVTERPGNWLNPKYATWNALFINVIDELIHKYWKPGEGLSQATWGRRNTVALKNRIGSALGPLGEWMNWPVLQLPGDNNMPRVQEPAFGASMRLVTRPNASTAAILEVPGGVSGHPLSAWYRKGFMAWAQGRPMPLLPGKTTKTLHFKPWTRAKQATAATAGSASDTENVLQ